MSWSTRRWTAGVVRWSNTAANLSVTPSSWPIACDINSLSGLSVLEDELVHKEASQDLDRLQVLIDVGGLGVSGRQTADWSRANCRLDVCLSDQRRVLATLSEPMIQPPPD